MTFWLLNRHWSINGIPDPLRSPPRTIFLVRHWSMDGSVIQLGLGWMRDANRHVDGTDNLFSIYLDLILYRVLRGFKHSPKTRFKWSVRCFVLRHHFRAQKCWHDTIKGFVYLFAFACFFCFYSVLILLRGEYSLSWGRRKPAKSTA